MMRKNLNRSYFALIFIMSIFILFILCKNNFFTYNDNPDKKNFNKYTKDCINLFIDLRNPDPRALFRPPLKEVPTDLLKEFTQNGEMPISSFWYFNDVYSDANKNYLNKNKPLVSKILVDSYRLKNGQRKEAYYSDATLIAYLMMKYSNCFKNKITTVIGTIDPWLEAIALDSGSSKVITLDYTRKEYEEKNLLEWMHVNDYLDYLILNDKIEQFDNAVSFSSIEHSGLGRYGDPLDPNGDVKAVRQIHCLLKPGGLFFIGLPTSSDNSSYIEFNAHRVYGHKRLAKLFQGWDLVEQSKRGNPHSVFVLRKKYN